MKKKLISIAVLLLFWASPALANPNDVDGWLGEWVVKENGQTVTWKIDEKAAGGSAGNWYFAYGIKNPGVDDTEFVIIRMPFIGYEHQYIEMAHSNVPADFPQNLDDYTFLLPDDADPYESFTTEPGGKYPVVSGERKPPIVAPVIAPIADQTILSGVAYTGPTPVLLEGSDVTWSLKEGPGGMEINAATGVVAWANPVADEYFITIKAENEAGSDTETFTLTVTDDAEPPVIKAIADQTIAEGVAYTYTAELESGTLPIAWSIDGPDGMVIDADTGVISWADPAGGEYEVTVTASNEGGEDTETFTLTVEIDPPVIGDIPDATIKEGVLYTVTPQLVSGSPPVTWALKHGPEGMTIDAQTGTVTWNNPVEGAHLIEITATNDAGTDQVDWMLTVVKEEPPGPCAAAYLLGADDPRLDILRQFRDQKMASSQTGNEMIDMYYEKSEDIIAICEANVFAKWSFKAMLEAIIPVIKLML